MTRSERDARSLLLQERHVFEFLLGRNEHTGRVETRNQSEGFRGQYFSCRMILGQKTCFRRRKRSPAPRNHEKGNERVDGTLSVVRNIVP